MIGSGTEKTGFAPDAESISLQVERGDTPVGDQMQKAIAGNARAVRSVPGALNEAENAVIDSTTPQKTSGARCPATFRYQARTGLAQLPAYHIIRSMSCTARDYLMNMRILFVRKLGSVSPGLNGHDASRSPALGFSWIVAIATFKAKDMSRHQQHTGLPRRGEDGLGVRDGGAHRSFEEYVFACF